jgi:RNA polymerase sigma-70 factor (ECF subfamily)
MAGAGHKPDGVDERDLARRAAGGDDAAFETLVNRYSRRIFDYCRRLVGDVTRAEDLAQETFVKFYFALHQYDPAQPLPPYLYRIAHNLCLDHLRKKKIPTVPLTWEEEDGEPRELPLADGRSAPDELADRAEVQAAIDEALGALPPLYRSALVLRYREGLAYDDIAATLNLPVGTVKAQLHRGREKLKQKLAAYV